MKHIVTVLNTIIWSLILIEIAFVILKLSVIINWSWKIVFIPILAILSIYFIAALSIVTYINIITIIELTKKHNND